MNSNNNIYNSQQQQHHRSVGYLPDEYQLHLVQRQHRRSVDVTMDNTTKNNNNNHNTKHDIAQQQHHQQSFEKWNVPVSGLDNTNSKVNVTSDDVGSSVTSIPIKQQLQQEQQSRTTSESTFVDEYYYNTSDDDNDEYFKNNDFSSDSDSKDFCVLVDDDVDDILVDYSSSTNLSSNENIVASNCIPALSLGEFTSANPAVVTEQKEPNDDEKYISINTAVHEHLEQQRINQQQNQPTDPEGSYLSICSAADDDKESIIGLRVVSVDSSSNPTSQVSNDVPYSTAFQMSLPVSTDSDATTTTEGRTTTSVVSSLAVHTPTKYDSSTTTSTGTSRISEMRKRRKEKEQFLVDRFARTSRLLDNKDNATKPTNYVSSDDEEELIFTPPFTPPPSIKDAVNQQHKLRSDSQHSPENKSESIHNNNKNMNDKVASADDIYLNNTMVAKERLEYLEHTLEVERTKRIQAEMKLSEMMENEIPIKKGSIRSSRQRTLSSSGSVRSMNSSNSNKSNRKGKLVHTVNGPRSITDGNNNNNSTGSLDSNEWVYDEQKGSDTGTGNNREQPVQLPVWVRRQLSSLQNTITIKDVSIESLTNELLTKDTEIHEYRHIIEDLKLSTSILPSNSTNINDSSYQSTNSTSNNNNYTDLTDSQHIAFAESIGNEHTVIQLNAAKKHILLLQNDVRNKNHELKRCDVTIADYEQQVHTLRNNLHESFQNQRDTERKVCMLMEQFEVDDVIDISEKFDNLTAINNETSTKLEQTTKEIQQVHMETLSILNDSKSYITERETEHEASRITHVKIVTELQTLLESTTKERDTIQHQIDCVVKQCYVTSFDEIPTKFIDLQVRCAQLEDATNDSKQIKQALDFLIDKVYAIQKLCNVDSIDELTTVCQSIVDERALLNNTKIELEQVRSDLVDSQKQIQILKEKNETQENDDIDDNDDKRIGKQSHRQITRTVSTASTDQTTIENESSFASVGVLSLDTTVSTAGCPGDDDKEENENELELHRQLSASRKNELQALDRIRVLEDDVTQREWKIAALEDQLHVLASKGDRSAELEHIVESLHKRISTANDEQLEFETRISMIQNICELNNVPDIPGALAELRENFTAARTRLTSSKDIQEFLTVGEELKQYANDALSKQLHDIQKELTRTKRELKRAKKNSDSKDETTISLDSISEFSYVGDVASMGSSEHNDPITVLQMELSRAETKSRLLQSEVNSLRKQLSFAENQIDELGKNRCARSRSGDDVSVDGLTGINLEFIDVDHAQSEDGNDVMFDVQRLQQVNQLKQREIDNLRCELEELAAQLTVARNAIEELEHERSYNQAKLSEMSSLVSSNFKTDTDQLLKEKSLECAELSFENETLKKNVNTSDSKLIVLQKDIEQKNYLIQQLSKFGKKDDGLSLDEFIVCLQEEHERSLGRVAEISVQLAQSQSKVDELKDQICKLHKQIDVLSPSATTQGIKAAESMIRRNIARARSNSYLFALDMSCEDDDEYLATAITEAGMDTNYGTDDEDEQFNSQTLVRNENTTVSPTGRSSPRRRKVTSRSKSFFM